MPKSLSSLRSRIAWFIVSNDDDESKNWITFIAPYCENYTSRALYKDYKGYIK